MPAPTSTPSTLQDAELQALAAQWRIRAMQGDRLAHRMAQALEAEQRRRVRDSGLLAMPPEPSKAAAPWWRFW